MSMKWHLFLPLLLVSIFVISCSNNPTKQVSVPKNDPPTMATNEVNVYMGDSNQNPESIGFSFPYVVYDYQGSSIYYTDTSINTPQKLTDGVISFKGDIADGKTLFIKQIGGNYTLEIFDIPNKQEFEIASSKDLDTSNFHINNGRVVYHIGDVAYLYDIVTKQTKPIELPPKGSKAYRIYDNYVLYSPGSGIYLYEIDTGLTRNLNSRVDCGISQHTIVFYEYVNNKWQFRFYDLNRGADIQQIEISGTSKCIIDNGVLYWDDKQGNIFSYTLSSRKQTKLNLGSQKYLFPGVSQGYMFFQGKASMETLEKKYYTTKLN